MLDRIIAFPAALLICSGAAWAQPSASTNGLPSEGHEVRIYDTSDLPSDIDLDALAVFVPMSVEKLTSSLYIIAALPADHDRLRDVLEQVRAIEPERITVVAAVHRLADIAGLEMGSRAPASMLAAPAVRRVHNMGTRRGWMALLSGEAVSYVEDLTPVVGANVAAFDPTLASAHSGLDLQIMVGDPEGGLSPVHVSGDWVMSSVVERRDAASLSNAAHGLLQVDMLTTARRSQNAQFRAPNGEPIVAAIVDDPESPGAVLVLTITVTAAP